MLEPVVPEEVVLEEVVPEPVVPEELVPEAVVLRRWSRLGAPAGVAVVRRSATRSLRPPEPH